MTLLLSDFVSVLWSFDIPCPIAYDLLNIIAFICYQVVPLIFLRLSSLFLFDLSSSRSIATSLLAATMKLTSTIAALAAVTLPLTSAFYKGFNVAAQNPDGSCKTQDQWAAAFKRLQGAKGHFTSVRLYASSDCNTLANAVPAALSTGTRILVGVWTEDAAHYQAEKDALQAAINAHGSSWIIAISVGSEDLYRGDTTASTLAQQIYDVRGMVRAMGVQQQVGHVDTWTAW